MDDFIRISGLSKNFGAVTAVDRLDLGIREGEFFTLLGSSGCGKTTTLRLIGGLEKPDGGEVWVGDRCLAAPARRIFVPPEKRNMGMVFQSYALWPHMTVFENVAYPLKLRWLRRAEVARRVREALDLVGLAGLEDRAVTALSGGQQQRVALARALVFSPNVLLLDEPLSNLDAQLRDEMRQELKGLQRRLGVTVVLVTHDQIEALSLSDRLAIMSNGRLEQLGTPEEVYHHPATPFVRDFLGTVLALDGRIVDASGNDIRVSVTGIEESCIAVTRAGDRRCGDASASGHNVTLVIRPEQVQVSARIAASEGNMVSARILESQFLGDRHEYTVSFGGQTRNLVLAANQRFAAGQVVYFTLPKDMTTLWNAGESLP
ncbi:MAG: ABC transporter ATP-binding protein [Pirellulaceae bacterium]